MKVLLLVACSPLFQLGGCFPDGFGKDLAASAVSAVTGDVLFTILDYVLPRPPV